MSVVVGDRSPDNDGDILPLAEALDLSRIVHEREVSSTMDVAHALASAGAEAGVLVVADRQRNGRGRGGHRWESARDDSLRSATCQNSVGVLGEVRVLVM